MTGEQLPLKIVQEVLEDSRRAGINRVRFYGGEPLLHRDLAKMVLFATELGMDPYVNTNGTLLAGKIDELFSAGLRWATIGFYGVEGTYDIYTQRPGRFARLEKSLSYVRERYGKSVDLQLNWLLMRPSCSVAALSEAWTFAERFGMALQVNLLSYSLDFFTYGPNEELKCSESDRGSLEAVSKMLVELKDVYPHRLSQSRAMLRAIPDLVLAGPKSRIPCDAYDSVWVGADGTVQLCDAAFGLGNVKKQRLQSILFGDAHRQACQDAFQLKCVNCHCKMDGRILKHAESMRKYA
jgi:MoaA/NifB/PqqE/SkfB family radical SAM enzyme